MFLALVDMGQKTNSGQDLPKDSGVGFVRGFTTRFMTRFMIT